jgi:hypothetical protein
MKIITSIIVASAIFAGGSAFANEGSGTDSISQAINNSRTAFSAQSTLQRNDFTASIPAAVIQNVKIQANVFPVNTSNLSQGGTR